MQFDALSFLSLQLLKQRGSYCRILNRVRKVRISNQKLFNETLPKQKPDKYKKIFLQQHDRWNIDCFAKVCIQCDCEGVDMFKNNYKNNYSKTTVDANVRERC